MSVRLQITSLNATAALARAVTAELRPGSVVLLSGELGAGKTTFTKALAEAVGVEEEVTSPTFTIMRPYEAQFSFGPASLLHLDAYRLGGPEPFDDLGLFELLDSGAVAVIEWGDLVAVAFPEALMIEFTLLEDDTRTAALTGDVECVNRIAADLHTRGLLSC